MRKIITGSLIAVLSLASSQTILALGTVSAEETAVVQNMVESKTEQTENTVDDMAKSTESDAPSKTARNTLRSQQQQIEVRKAQLRDEMKKQLDERKQKLEGSRLAQCQNRQVNINRLIDKSAEVGKQRLARIQRFEEGVKAFYVKQALSSVEYASVVQSIDQKEAAAIAALDVTASQEFECTDVDGSNPSAAIKLSHSSKRTALNEYRDAVKELITVVKTALAEKKAESETNQ